ncbi:MAG: hypothetical protein R2851_22540 [Caldilineaceae bacterium]
MSNPHAGRIAAHTMQQEYRKLPAVDTLLRDQPSSCWRPSTAAPR